MLRAVHATGIKFTGAVSVETTVFLPTKDAKRWGKPHTLKPDRDNLDKAILDAVSAAGAWPDDCIVWSGGLRKVWCKPGQEGAVLLIQETPKVEAVSPPWEAGQAPEWVG